MTYPANECRTYILPVRDLIDLIGGKWRLPAVVALSFGPCRFNELERLLDGISPRMLSKVLKDLELNGLVQREVLTAKPVAVRYSLTEYGQSLDRVIEAMRAWGTTHRKRIMHAERTENPTI